MAAGDQAAPELGAPQVSGMTWGQTIGWTERERNTERKHRLQLAKLSVKAAYERGRADREHEARPSAYEMWRDAWNLAAATSGPDYSPGAIRDNAEWFHDRLKAGPPGPPTPDCEHCGADSSMDHDDDCPNADNGLRADEDPTDDEVDCVRCGAPPGGHPEGCPTMHTAPPHDDGEYKRTVSSRIDD